MAWSDWAQGVLADPRIGALATQTNLETLAAWSVAESGSEAMRWNNPLNTTQELLAAIDIDPDMNRVGVESYATIAEGVIATAVTLSNGRYPLIVDHLRRSLPSSAWGDCCGELATWGTGCAWIGAHFGASEQALLGEDMTPQQDQTLTAIWQIVAGAHLNGPSIDEYAQKILAGIAAIQPVNTQAILAAIADLKAHPDPTAAAIATRIENALKSA